MSLLIRGMVLVSMILFSSCAFSAQVRSGGGGTSSSGGGVGVGTTNPGTVNYLSVYKASITLGPSTYPIVDNGAGIGIGSVSPGSALDVNGTVKAIAFNSGASSTPQVDLYPALAGDTHWIVGVAGDGGGDNNDNLVISEGTSLNSSNRVTVAPGGVVTIPTAKFTTISGSPNFSGNLGIGTTLANGLSIMSNNVGIGTWIPNATLDIQGNSPLININKTDSSWLSGASGDGQIVVQGTTSSEAFFIDTSTGAINTLVLDKGSATSNGNSLGAFKFGGVDDNLHGTNFVSSALIQAKADQNFTSSAHGTYIIFQATPNNSTTKTEYMRIASTGNVGISTVNPGQGLDVGGTLKIRDIGIGTTVPQELCRKSDGTFGVYNGVWASVCS